MRAKPDIKTCSAHAQTGGRMSLSCGMSLRLSGALFSCIKRQMLLATNLLELVMCSLSKCRTITDNTAIPRYSSTYYFKIVGSVAGYKIRAYSVRNMYIGWREKVDPCPDKNCTFTLLPLLGMFNTLILVSYL